MERYPVNAVRLTVPMVITHDPCDAVEIACEISRTLFVPDAIAQITVPVVAFVAGTHQFFTVAVCVEFVNVTVLEVSIGHVPVYVPTKILSVKISRTLFVPDALDHSTVRRSAELVEPIAGKHQFLTLAVFVELV